MIYSLGCPITQHSFQFITLLVYSMMIIIVITESATSLCVRILLCQHFAYQLLLNRFLHHILIYRVVSASAYSGPLNDSECRQPIRWSRYFNFWSRSMIIMIAPAKMQLSPNPLLREPTDRKHIYEAKLTIAAFAGRFLCFSMSDP